MSRCKVYCGNNTNKTDRFYIWKKNLELRSPSGKNRFQAIVHGVHPMSKVK